MKALIVYDSVYGNTKQVALAIGAVIQNGLTHADECSTCYLGDVEPQDLSGVDLLVFGAPTQQFRPAPNARNFLKRMPKHSLHGVIFAAFDTRITEEEIQSHGRVVTKLFDVFGYAAPRIADRLEKAGGKMLVAPEGFFVGGTEGPLTDGELERAAHWANEILAQADTSNV
mgnify:CR=1 FL=1